MGHRCALLNERNVLGHSLALRLYHIDDLALGGFPSFHAHAGHEFLEFGICINLLNELSQDLLLVFIYRRTNCKVVHTGEVYVNTLILEGRNVTNALDVQTLGDEGAQAIQIAIDNVVTVGRRRTDRNVNMTAKTNRTVVTT